MVTKRDMEVCENIFMRNDPPFLEALAAYRAEIQVKAVDDVVKIFDSFASFDPHGSGSAIIICSEHLRSRVRAYKEEIQ